MRAICSNIIVPVRTVLKCFQSWHMRHIFLFIPFLVLVLKTVMPLSTKSQNNIRTEDFKLLFMTIGFGSNYFSMQPLFRVNGARFVYTSEEVWISPGQRIIERDTLLSGVFRKSSIDSIVRLISNLKDTAIRRSNVRVSSGSACSLEIISEFKRITFWLHNKSDTTADQIVKILNSYIPQELNKLYISNFKGGR